jgi:hypothetical protein
MATLLIHESRRIVLPFEAAVDAVLQLDWDNGGWLAEAPLTEAWIETGDNPALMLTVQRPGGLQSETRRYSLPAVAAAIIHLCSKARIPLPRSWKKRIAVVPEGFEFTLEGTVEIPRHHGPLPEVRAQRSPRPDLPTAPPMAPEQALPNPPSSNQSAAASDSPP